MKNLKFLREALLICAGVICLMFIAGIKEALICLLIAAVFSVIFMIIRRSINKKITGLTNRLLNESELIPGDAITLNPSEILPVDSVLLDSQALFAPVFATSGTAPTEYLQGDDVPSGYRLMSDEPVTLHVTTHYDNSTFTKYIHAFENGSDEFPKSLLSLFFDKLQLYSFQKGVLISKNLKKLAKTRAFYIAKSAVIKSSEYSIASICPAKTKIDKETLLRYAAQAEIPYAHTNIGSVLLKECSSEVLLSAVKRTEKYPELGIITEYNKDTIHAGCKEFLTTSGINKLPDFEAIEADSNVNDTFIYIALNNSYIGYILLQAPLKGSYNEFLDYITKKRLFMKVVSHNSPDEADSLVATRQRLQKKRRTSYVAYIDSKPTDSTLQRLSDYNIFLGSEGYCPENDFDGVTIIPNSFKTLLRTIILTKKVCFTVNFYAALLLLIKASLITVSFLLPGINVWHALLATGILNTALIKIYDLFFRHFTRFN